MAGEDWTFASMLVYVDRRFADQQEAVRSALAASNAATDAALRAAGKATDKAEQALTDRLASLNELRAAMQDQSSTLLPRAVFETAHQGLLERMDRENDAFVERVTELARRIDVHESTQAGGAVTVAKFYSAIAAVAVVVGLLTWALNHLALTK